MKYFSHEEAQQRIPELEKIFALAHEIRSKAQDKLGRIRLLEEAAATDPAQIAIEKSQLEFLAQCLEQNLRGIETMGAVLKGLDPALVDFPHRLGGEDVYLCWREGEKNIRHYHGMDEGFAGRRPLPRPYLHH